MTTQNVNDALAEEVCELASQMSMSIRCRFLSRSHCHSWTVPLTVQVLFEQIPLLCLRPCFGLSLTLLFKKQEKAPIYRVKFSSIYFHKPIFNSNVRETYMKEI